MLLFQARNLRKNAEKPGRRAPERVPLPGFLSINWHVVFKMKAHRRAVPGRGSLFPSLAAVSSAAIPVRVKLKTPLRIAAAATTVDVPSRWDLQQRRPRPVADAGRSCWGSGQQDASAAQGTRGCWEPQPGALKKSPVGSFLPPAGGRVPSIPRTGQNGSNHDRHS